MEPVDLSIKTPVVLQVPKYPPQQRLRNPVPQNKVAVTPSPPPPPGKQQKKTLFFSLSFSTFILSRLFRHEQQRQVGRASSSARTHQFLKELILSRNCQEKGATVAYPLLEIQHTDKEIVLI